MSGQGQSIKTNINYNLTSSTLTIDNKYIILNSTNNGIYIQNTNSITDIFAIIDTDTTSYKLINNELFNSFTNITTTLNNQFILLKFSPTSISTNFTMFESIESSKEIKLYELFILTDNTKNTEIETYLLNKYNQNLHTYISFDTMSSVSEYLLFDNILNSFSYMSVGINNDKTLKAINISDNSKSYPNSNLSYFATENNNINILSVPKIAPINTDKLEICGFQNGIIKPVIDITNKIDNTNIQLNINTECNINQDIYTPKDLRSRDIYLSSGDIYSQSGNMWLHASSNMYFRLNGSDKLQITSSGVGIGTSPSYPLDVNGNIKCSGSFIGDGSQLTGLSGPWSTTNSSWTGTTRTVRVGSATQASGWSFYVDSNAYISSLTAPTLTASTIYYGGMQLAKWRLYSSNRWYSPSGTWIGINHGASTSFPVFPLDVRGYSQGYGDERYAHTVGASGYDGSTYTFYIGTPYANHYTSPGYSNSNDVYNPTWDDHWNSTMYIADVPSGSSQPLNYHPFGIHTEHSIYISNGAVFMSSDERIKCNIRNVDPNEALEVIRKIETKVYNYYDYHKRGTNPVVGFIAQNVRKYYPAAVSLNTQCIPNVMKTINVSWNSFIENDKTKYKMSTTDLSNINGIKYKFYVSHNSDSSDEKEIDVIGNSDNTFTFDAQYTNVFCYGNEVDDFHTLDEEKIFVLHHSAIQELDRIQQTHITKIETLESENTELKEEVNTLKSEVATLKDELSQIKNILLSNNIN